MKDRIESQILRNSEVANTVNIKNEKVRNLMTYENEYSEPCTRILKYIF